MYYIARPVNNITLNPIEYVLDENNEPELFADERGARQFIVENEMGNPDDYIIEKLIC